MLRLHPVDLKNKNNVFISENALFLNNEIWKNSKDICMGHRQQQEDRIQLIPIKNEAGRLIAYGYQDNEANRELRMLKELAQNKNALQFTDIFPEYKEVVIYGCNELAISFKEYLENLGVSVSVIGKYWEYFGQVSNYNTNLNSNELIVYAEGIVPPNADLYQTVQRSCSAEFECIDKVYEANVFKGRIQDTIGGFDDFINRLKGKQEIVILGTDREAQDTYDLLLQHGVDILGFAVGKDGEKWLLGKKVMSIAEAMRYLQNPVFLNYRDTHGALGSEQTEYFDYFGYERNEQFFLVKDYTEIPESNLIHVLHRKCVLLTGDARLCQLLSVYLSKMENDEIEIRYVSLGEKIFERPDDILCLIIPDYSNYLARARKKREVLNQKLLEMNFVHYTEYFININSFVMIDKYLNENHEKYAISKLRPKGILLGRIPAASGNIFFRSIMDGHPEVLIIPYSDFNNYLFYYCVRLAGINSEEILASFWEMYDEEWGSREQYFSNLKGFNISATRLLKLKNYFTSQELFVLFHIAYAEMRSGKRITNITSLIIYWEPHIVSRSDFPFFALWLEDKSIEGQTIWIHRDHIVRTGSLYTDLRDKGDKGDSLDFRTRTMFAEEFACEDVNVRYHYWNEFKVRFEDIKLKPREKLLEVCDRLGIEWSDNMLQTTLEGKPWVYSRRNTTGFDLKPVFNRHEDIFSEFDRFRISIAGAPYQKRYGYPYENCLKFSRRELQEMFIKPFLFDEKKIFETKAEEYVKGYEWIKWQLWEIRKFMLLDNVCSEFGSLELGETGDEVIAEYSQKKIGEALEYVRTHNKLILYGTGNDCQSLVKLMEGNERERLLYSDKKAETHPFFFLGKKVIAPSELCTTYKDYNILVTSSLYRRNIEKEFYDMAIMPSRIFYNEVEFGKKK